MNKEKSNNNCYSESEAGFMLWGQNFRAILFKPLLKLLLLLKIKPNHLTILSLICGILGAFLLMTSLNSAFILIFLHVLFDGLDGPLAREMNIDSNQGSFVDSCCDQLVIAFIIFILIHIKIIDPILGGVFILLYSIVVGFAMVRNSLKIPYQWLIRPRFIVYLWLPIEFYLLHSTINYVLLIFNIILAIKTISGFFKIKDRI